MAVRPDRKAFDDAVHETLRVGALLMVRQVLGAACRDDRLHRRHRRVLVAICDHLNGQSGMAFPGWARLAQVTGLGLSTIGPTLSGLRRWGYVVDSRRARQSGERAIAHYTVRLPKEANAAAGDTAGVAAGDTADGAAGDTADVAADETADVATGGTSNVAAGDSAEVAAGETAEVAAGDTAATNRETHRATDGETQQPTDRQTQQATHRPNGA